MGGVKERAYRQEDGSIAALLRFKNEDGSDGFVGAAIDPAEAILDGDRVAIHEVDGAPVMWLRRDRANRCGAGPHPCRQGASVREVLRRDES